MENPRIVGLDGLVEGKVFAIPMAECSVGRDRMSTIHVPDASVSRRHCKLTRLDPGGVRITDLSSRNGTFVNGVPVTDRVLEHRDEIRLGKCTFIFLSRPDETETPSAVLSPVASSETRTMFQLRRQDSIYLSPAQALEPVAEPRRIAHSLKTLFRISSAIRINRGLEELAGELLGLIGESVPASEAALLLFEAGASEPTWAYGWKRDGGAVRELPVPEPLVRTAFTDDVAVLSNELIDSSGGDEDQTEVPVCSAMAAPLRGAEKTVGVLYLGSTEPRVCFDEEQLQLVTAVTSISGMAIENALQFDRLAAENKRLRDEIQLDHDMVGESQPMQRVYQFVTKVAPTDATVLIAGESGTGKELVARAIHRNSPRSGAPFVAVNCAALTETLLESELFGHEKGAFTGAVAQKKGKFEVANTGTIFLDEIGEMPVGLQSELLRVLQEREFERVGGTKPVPVDVRVIAATNRDLKTEIGEGRFREDLYYRLNVVSIRMPALREHPDDIPLLANYFASRFGARVGRRLNGISPGTQSRLKAHHWPGNVRELENVIERAVVLGSSGLILPEDLPEELLEITPPSPEPSGGYHEAVREAKQRIILQAIEQAGGSQAAAARLLGVNPTYLSRLIRNLDLKDRIGRNG